MPSYVDGYVIPLKKTDVKAYKKLASLGCKILSHSVTNGACNFLQQLLYEVAPSRKFDARDYLSSAAYIKYFGEF